MRFMTSTFFALMLCFVLGCATPIKSPLIGLGDRSTLAFTGRGAAAGMMIDSYMAGAGIAIGIAIDEGIAKDAAQVLKNRPSGFDVISVFQGRWVEFCRQKNQKKSANDQSVNCHIPPTITVDNYGFRSAPNDGEQIAGWIKLRVKRDLAEKVVEYPKDFSKVSTMRFDEFKKQPDVLFQIFQDAVDQVIESSMAP